MNTNAGDPIILLKVMAVILMTASTVIAILVTILISDEKPGKYPGLAKIAACALFFAGLLGFSFETQWQSWVFIFLAAVFAEEGKVFEEMSGKLKTWWLKVTE